MIDSVTKFLERVDQKAGEIANQGRDAPAASHGDIASTAPSAHAQGVSGASSVHHLPQPEFSPLPSETASMRKIDDEAMAKRDQTLVQLQRDYDDMAARARELSAALERKQHEADGNRHALEDALREADRLRDGLRRRDAAQISSQEELDGLRAALYEAQTAGESARQDLAISSVQKRQWELQCKTATEELADYKRKTITALAEKDARIMALTSAAENASGGHGIEQLRNESDQTKQRLAAAEASLNVAQAECARLRAQVSDRATASASVSSELAASQRREMAAVEASKVAQAMFDGEVASHQGTRSRLEGALRDRDEEIRLLQKQINQLQRPSTSHGDGSNDWERRAKDLAEVVLEKQAALEAKRSECDQWKARLEAAQQRIREMELISISSNPTTHRIIPMGTEDRDEGLLGEFSRSQFFGNLSRKGKVGAQISSAARVVDGLSLSAGKLLKRNSVLRVCVILYVIVLQFWCFVAVSMTPVPQSPDVPH